MYITQKYVNTIDEVTFMVIFNQTNQLFDPCFSNQHSKINLSAFLNKSTLYENKTSNFDCPHCTSCNVIKHGKFNNKQRFMCKECKKTFCQTTNTIFYYSKKSIFLWEKYIELMLNIMSLRDCAQKLNINISTAFLWRHKLLHTLNPIMEPSELSNSINIRRLLKKESFKGSKKITTPARRNIWIYSSCDNNDKIIAKPMCFPILNMKRFNDLIFNQINKNSYVYTNCDRFVIAISKRHNQGIKEFIDPNSKILLNNFANYFISLILCYRGIATKYLCHYLPLTKILASSKIYDSLSIINKVIEFKSYLRRDDLKDVFSM